MNKPVLNSLLHEKLFDQATFNIAVIDKQYNIVDTNRFFERTYGKKWKGEKCHRVLKGNKRRCRECKAVKTFRDGRTRVSQEQGKDKDGNTIFYLVQYFPIKDEQGKIPYIVEMSIDVTSQVKIENEHQLLFNNVPCTIAIVDRNLRIEKTNSLFDEKFGRKGAIHCYEAYKVRKRRCGNCPVVKAFETGQIQKSLQVGVDRKGNKSHYMVTAAPIGVDEKKRAGRVMQLLMDVSEVMSLQRRLEQVEKEKIEAERLAAVGQTVAGLSHGIKNVLMGLEGGMYVVNSGLNRKDDDIVQRGWDMLENNITRISALVKEFLSFARGTDPDIRMIDPTDIVRQIEGLFRGLAEKSEVSFTVKMPGSMAKAPMDPEGIHTCLANLISNALDACLISDKKKRRIVVSCYEKDDTIFLAVKDNGCGMDNEIKKKVFSSFFTTKGSGEGTGLGLLVTRKIVSQHGGKISVKSARNRGSEFTLEFQRKRLPRVKKEK